MVLVLGLIGLVVVSGINGKRAQSGDAAAAKRAPVLSLASMVTFLLTVATAVLAFD